MDECAWESAPRCVKRERWHVAAMHRAPIVDWVQKEGRDTTISPMLSPSQLERPRTNSLTCWASLPLSPPAPPTHPHTHTHTLLRSLRCKEWQYGGCVKCLKLGDLWTWVCTWVLKQLCYCVVCLFGFSPKGGYKYYVVCDSCGSGFASSGRDSRWKTSICDAVYLLMSLPVAFKRVCRITLKEVSIDIDNLLSGI